MDGDPEGRIRARMRAGSFETGSISIQFLKNGRQTHGVGVLLPGSSSPKG